MWFFLSLSWGCPRSGLSPEKGHFVGTWKTTKKDEEKLSWEICLLKRSWVSSQPISSTPSSSFEEHQENSNTSNIIQQPTPTCLSPSRKKKRKINLKWGHKQGSNYLNREAMMGHGPKPSKAKPKTTASPQTTKRKNRKWTVMCLATTKTLDSGCLRDVPPIQNEGNMSPPRKMRTSPTCTIC